VTVGSALAVRIAVLRAGAERAHAHAMFLAQAAIVLEETLDSHTALRRLADLAVPRLADWCAMHLVHPDGTPDLVTIAHSDPSRARRIQELERRWPARPDSPTGPGHVLQTGEPELFAHIPDDLLVAAARDDEHLAALRELELWASICVPLQARGHTLGTMLLVSADSHRRFRHEDLERALDLAAAAALAVDNARLYEEAREQERQSAAARAELERSHERASFLAQASAMLESSLDARRTLGEVARLLVTRFADLATVDVLAADGSIRRLGPATARPELEPALRELVERYPLDPQSEHPIARVLRSGRRELIADVGDDVLGPIAVDQEHLDLMRTAVGRTALLLPLRAHGRVVGVLSLRWMEPNHPIEPDELALVEDLASRIALAADNARIYEERDYVARTLARSLLPPELPRVPGFEIGAQYLPAARDAAVSGDFYDVFALGDGRWALLVGDVCGKGAGAAALTALARHTLRAAAITEPEPARVLELLNESMLRGRADGRFCTVCYANLEPWPGMGGRVTIACGGHPAPLILRSGGTIEEVAATGTLIGVFAHPSLPETQLELAVGDSLVLFTDGVTEAGLGADSIGDDWIGATLRANAGLGAQELAEQLAARAIELQGGTPRDDIAVLALRAVG
jgi:serine phosphatase RsbU (regulator of sigma subunit)